MNRRIDMNHTPKTLTESKKGQAFLIASALASAITSVAVYFPKHQNVLLALAAIIGAVASVYIGAEAKIDAAAVRSSDVTVKDVEQVTVTNPPQGG
jgi:hypothetical protein